MTALTQDRSYYDPETALKMAIEKAIAGGWKNLDGAVPITINGIVFLIHKSIGRPEILFDPAELIFNHDFAKALWGETEDHFGYGHHYNIDHNPDFPEEKFSINMTAPTYQLKLVQMLLADDPIKYLGENI